MATLLNSLRLRIPCVPGRSPSRSALPDKLAKAAPAVFSTSDLRVEFALLASDAATILEDISIAESVTVRVKTSETASDALLSLAIAAIDLNQGLVQADWDAGTDQHGVAEFTNAETNLIAVGAEAQEFWLHIFYTTTESPLKQVTIYSGPITFYPPQISLNVGPISGASIVPATAAYDGSGEYTLTVIDGKRYGYTKAANDATLVNDAETLSATGNFTAAGTTVLLTGTPSAVITASVRPLSVLTPEESDARYVRIGDSEASSHEAVSFSAAGNTNITPGVNSVTHGVVATVGAGAGSYTRTLALLTANSSAGDLIHVRFDMPASANPIIQVRNATSGGTLLTTINGETGGVPLHATYEFNGTAWIEMGVNYVE